MHEEDLHESVTLGGLAGEDSTQDYPVKSWDRYKFVAFIGEGGMGRVFKAFDPRLKRFVALKFIRGDDPTIRKRFLQEAQSQARIEHPNVCKVYEAGEVEGKFYIAMQYIDGGTLNATAKLLTLEQKVILLQQVAEGLHSAHRNGLIHRDVKPGNIMVEKTEDGWHPYLMDFGLVREVTAQGVTLTGVLVGTPHYMSPEQAWGDVQKLDRRVDIYSLGATMYEFLTGTLPLDSESTMEVLRKVLEEEPKPLRQIISNIPADLETIVLKCLEKDPVRRYESARALAEDLQRYLDGEPIQARRASISYRLTKKARKHKALVGVSVVAVAIITGLVVTAIRSQIQARDRAMLAQRFGRQVEKMEGLMRLSHISPLHDVRGEKNAVRKRMQEIKNQMIQLGEPAQASGHYALGRGYLSLNEFEKAHEHLQKAWGLEYQTSEVAYAIGLALGNIYQKLLADSEQIRNKDEREARIRELNRKYRDPAVSYLLGIKNLEESSPDYVEGLISLYQKNYDKGLELARKAVERTPWLYEARILEGRIHTQKGNDKRDRGDYSNAFLDYEKGITAYKKGLQTGESDPAAYEGLCNLYHNMIFVEVFQTGREIESYGKESEIACGKAIQADPEFVSAYYQMSRNYGLWSRFKSERGQDPTTEFNRSIEYAQKAVRITPTDYSYDVLAAAYRFRAEHEMYNGIDPKFAVEQIIFSGKKALELNPNNIQAYGNIGMGYLIQAEYEMAHGQDPRKALNLAILNYEKSAELKPGNYGILNSLGNAYAQRGDFEYSMSLDPTASFKSAMANYHKALEINPNYTHAFNNLGTSYEAMGKFELRSGKDPSLAFQEAEKYYRQTMKLNPSYQHPYVNLGITLRYRAEYEMSQGRDSSKILESAAEINQKGLDISSDAIDETARADIHLIEAEYALLKNRSPEKPAAKAKQFLESARKKDPLMQDIYILFGKTDLILVKWQNAKKGRSESSLKSAEQYLKKALQLDSQNAFAFILLGECHRLKSQRSGSLAEIDAGLAIIEKAINLDSKLADAYAVRGLLLLQKSKSGNIAIRDAGYASIRKALELNQNLKYLYSKYLN